MSALCDEVEFLKETAEENFFDALALFGFSEHDDEEEWPEGEREVQIGRILHVLQRLYNFVRRCKLVLLNLVHQVCATDN